MALNHSLKSHNFEWSIYQTIANTYGCNAYDIYEKLAFKYLKAITPEGETGFIKPTSLNSYDHTMYLIKIIAEMDNKRLFIRTPEEVRILIEEREEFNKYEFKKFTND